MNIYKFLEIKNDENKILKESGERENFSAKNYSK